MTQSAEALKGSVKGREEGAWKEEGCGRQGILGRGEERQEEEWRTASRG